MFNVVEHLQYKLVQPRLSIIHGDWLVVISRIANSASDNFPSWSKELKVALLTLTITKYRNWRLLPTVQSKHFNYYINLYTLLKGSIWKCIRFTSYLYRTVFKISIKLKVKSFYMKPFMGSSFW